MSKQICSIDSCTKLVRALGMCQMHYKRNKLYGDPGIMRRKQRGATEVSPIHAEGEFSYVLLSQNKEAKIDTIDAVVVGQFNWYYSTSTGYAYSSRAGTSLQQFLLGRAPVDQIIDHKDRDKLNCSRKNLHFVCFSENSLNSERSANAKHISFHKSSNKYQAYLAANRKFLYLGVYKTKDEAEYAVDKGLQLLTETGNVDDFRASWKIMRKRGEELKRDE